MTTPAMLLLLLLRGAAAADVTRRSALKMRRSLYDELMNE